MNENLFEIFDTHLMNDEKPSDYFNTLTRESFHSNHQYLDLLFDLKNIEQNPKYHPEGNVWNHTMMVIDLAAKYKLISLNQRVFMWASLLHDIGKSTTTTMKKGRLVSYNHDKEGQKLAKKFLEIHTEDAAFIQKTSALVRWHMQPFFIAKDLPFADIPALIRDIQPSEVGLFSYCDRLGRGPITKENKSEVNLTLAKFIKKCSKQIKDTKELKRINTLLETINSIN
jgi:putative nucleotidyltransferase with HDIG domain